MHLPQPSGCFIDLPTNNVGDHVGLHVLITASYYAPELTGTAPYVTGMAEDLARRGHEVTVATTFRHYPEWVSTAHGRLANREVLNGVHVRRRALYVPSRQTALRRGLYEATMYGAGLTALGLRRAPNVIIGFQPSLAGGVLAATASRIYRRPFGLVVHDLLGPGATQSGLSGGGSVAARVTRLELATARKAAGLAIVADSFRDYFQDSGVAADRIRRVRTWTRDAEPTETYRQTRARLGWSSESFVCVHAGNMGQKQGLGNVLGAARLLMADNGIRFALVGDGNDRARLECTAREMKLTNVDFIEVQPSGKYEALLRAADVLLVNQRAAVGDMSLPSKLTSYFAAARPVVAAVASGGETAREMRAANAGPVVTPDSPHALAQGLESMRDDPSQAETYGRCARKYAEEVLSSRAILAQYREFTTDLAKSGSVAPSRRPTPDRSR